MTRQEDFPSESAQVGDDHGPGQEDFLHPEISWPPELLPIMDRDPDEEKLEEVVNYLMNRITHYSKMLAQVQYLQMLARGVSDDGSEEAGNASS